MNTRRIGDRGEKLALNYLSGLGYGVVERNYRTRYGEIDLIARDAETLIFVEVKLRRSTAYGNPLESVTPRKQEQVRSIAEQYLDEARERRFLNSRPTRFGVE
jgi:putative endonuclease